jgi:hypothetical protein
MTADEWDCCTDLEAMLAFLGRKPRRKLMLFGCACLRRIWHQLTDRRCRRLVEIAERDADGRARPQAVAAAIRQAKARNLKDDADRFALFAFWALRDWMERPGPHIWSHTKASVIAENAANAVAYETFQASGHVADVAMNTPLWHAAEATERATQCDLLRDLFGNPFRRVVVEPVWLGWNDGTVVKLAECIYTERDWSTLPVLADALEDAGCNRPELLAHLRGPGPHARGCHVLDALLGKE